MLLSPSRPMEGEASRENNCRECKQEEEEHSVFGEAIMRKVVIVGARVRSGFRDLAWRLRVMQKAR